MALKSASDQCPAMVPAIAPNSFFRTPCQGPSRQPKRPSEAAAGAAGFGLTLGYTMVYLSLLVLIPLSRCSFAAWDWAGVTSGRRDGPRVTASLRLSFGASLIAALIM